MCVCVYIYIYIYAMSHGMWDLNSPIKDQTCALMQGMCRVLTTGPPEKSPFVNTLICVSKRYFFFLKGIFKNHKTKKSNKNIRVEKLCKIFLLSSNSSSMFKFPICLRKVINICLQFT